MLVLIDNDYLWLLMAAKRCRTTQFIAHAARTHLQTRNQAMRHLLGGVQVSRAILHPQICTTLNRKKMIQKKIYKQRNKQGNNTFSANIITGTNQHKRQKNKRKFPFQHPNKINTYSIHIGGIAMVAYSAITNHCRSS